MRAPGIRLHKLALFGWAVVVTAVLLLLSLPVLAGELFIAPALNLAICWNMLFVFITLSAGNLLSLNFLGILRDCTPKFVCFLKNYNRFNKIHIRWFSVIHIENSVMNDPFAFYLTGLIEGDGTIIVPLTERSIKGKLNYPSIQIVFHLKDLPLALIIQKSIGHGSVSRKKGVNAYIYTVNNLEGIQLIINLVNGKMKTNKIYALHSLIDWLRIYRDIYLDKKPLNFNNVKAMHDCLDL